jgi:hypothetical protein
VRARGGGRFRVSSKYSYGGQKVFLHGRIHVVDMRNGLYFPRYYLPLIGVARRRTLFVVGRSTGELERKFGIRTTWRSSPGAIGNPVSE